MAGKKLFTNSSAYNIYVTLIIRKSSDPRDTAGTKDFKLTPKQSLWITYGNNVDIYLNGIKLEALLNGERIGQQVIVIKRGSSLDNQLNMKNGVSFGYDRARNSFSITTKQVY
jgi:hypothetical protein